MSQNAVLENSTVEIGSISPIPKRTLSQGEIVGRYVVSTIKSGKQLLLFLGGEAGTGKTTCIREITEIIKKSLPNMNVTLLGPTHSVVAQLPAGATTCHSAARLSHPDNEFPLVSRKDPDYEKRTGITIVDEISLLSGASFAEWDQKNRQRTGKNLPFGGMHMLIIGDLLQLQMGRIGEQISEARQLDDFTFHELSQVHRQERDTHFVEFLKRARIAEVDESMLKFVNERVTHRGTDYVNGAVNKFIEIYSDNSHILTSTNKMRRIFNDRIIARKFETTEILHEKLQCVHYADSSITYEAVPKSQSFAIAAGVRIITTASMMDKEGETVPNGTMGTVMNFSKLDGHIHYVNIQFDGAKKIQRFGRQNPHGAETLSFNFQPSYALTYHRAQGRTMDGVVLDIQGKMYAGAFYTGISRVRDASRVFFNGRIYNLAKLKTIILACENSKKRLARLRLKKAKF